MGIVGSAKFIPLLGETVGRT